MIIRLTSRAGQARLDLCNAAHVFRAVLEDRWHFESSGSEESGEAECGEHREKGFAGVRIFQFVFTF